MGWGRATVEAQKRITTKYLREHNYLTGHTSGYISWNWGGTETGSCNIETDVSPGKEYIRFIYTGTDSNGDKKDYDYKAGLTFIKCNYGGRRWFFVCPYCKKNAGVLHLGGSGFACRHCYNLTYNSCNENRRGLGGVMDKLLRAEALEKKITKRFYKGQYTKKYRRYLSISRRIPDKEQLSNLLNKG